MPRFVTDPDRLNLTTSQSGKEYNLRLVQRAQTIFTNLMDLLPSNYISTIRGPNYSIELGAVATELARMELSLEDVYSDQDFTKTRTDFLYSIIEYMVFLNNKLPKTSYDDLEFRTFLTNVIAIYFRGSIPSAILEAVELFFSDPSLLENFLLTRNSGSGLDISDEFGFQLDITDTASGFPSEVFTLESNTRLLLDIIRPAHTIFKIRYIFSDTYSPNQGSGILDSSRGSTSSYYYEDLRVFSSGLFDIDRLGVKVNRVVTAEVHSNDF